MDLTSSLTFSENYKFNIVMQYFSFYLVMYVVKLYFQFSDNHGVFVFVYFPFFFFFTCVLTGLRFFKYDFKIKYIIVIINKLQFVQFK